MKGITIHNVQNIGCRTQCKQMMCLKQTENCFFP